MVGSRSDDRLGHSQTEEKVMDKLKVVYAGKRYGKVHYELFYTMESDNSLGVPLTFKKGKGIRYFRIGHVYEVGRKGDEFLLSKNEWIEEYHDKEQVRAWQAEYQADRTLAASGLAERRYATNDSALRVSMTQLRIAYQQLAPAQRLGFEAWVLNQLRKG